ncbi:hypothetical protein NQ315_005653 [Exocentrus adspersus]|uniref:CCHC-type domain-containing protein n=1 Tax=Exocentrus adspersus TaxID=1586481 RepID=A0AAV8V6V9_9CUCU|nr:hypothetical protein NQ315_005653 [Exocentrus adspersus]
MSSRRTNKRQLTIRPNSPSGSSERSPSRQRSRSSAEAGDPMDRLTEALNNFFQHSVQQNHSNVTTGRGDVVPDFNPEDKEQTAIAWCQKVDELREIYGWSEEATIYFATSKLRGLANVWYKSLPNLKFSWLEWKEKVKIAFPGKRDYFGDLMEMIRRQKRFEESYTKYYYEKTAMLNVCKISGSDAVSCIIGGITDVVVKTGASAGNHATPESLCAYLSTLTETAKKADQSYKFVKKPVLKNFSRNRNAKASGTLTCFTCNQRGHVSKACPQGRSDGHRGEGADRKYKPNLKYYKPISINGTLSLAYVHLGSSCTTITLSETEHLGLQYNSEKRTTLQEPALNIVIDDITITIEAYVVPDSVQEVPVLLGRNFSELPDILAIKDNVSLKFFKHAEINKIEPAQNIRKVALQLAANTTVLPNSWGHLQVYSDAYEGDLCIDASVRSPAGKDYCIPHTVITVTKGQFSIVPCINLSDKELYLKKDTVFARAYPCVGEAPPVEKISMIKEGSQNNLPEEQMIIGNVDQETRGILIALLNEYRDCFALSTSELGCAKSAKLQINLSDNKPFSHRPYRPEACCFTAIVTGLLLPSIV